MTKSKGLREYKPRSSKPAPFPMDSITIMEYNAQNNAFEDIEMVPIPFGFTFGKRPGQATYRGKYGFIMGNDGHWCFYVSITQPKELFS